MPIVFDPVMVATSGSRARRRGDDRGVRAADAAVDPGHAEPARARGAGRARSRASEIDDAAAGSSATGMRGARQGRPCARATRSSTVLVCADGRPIARWEGERDRHRRTPTAPAARWRARSPTGLGAGPALERGGRPGDPLRPHRRSWRRRASARATARSAMHSGHRRPIGATWDRLVAADRIIHRKDERDSSFRWNDGRGDS